MKKKIIILDVSRRIDGIRFVANGNLFANVCNLFSSILSRPIPCVYIAGGISLFRRKQPPPDARSASAGAEGCPGALEIPTRENIERRVRGPYDSSFYDFSTDHSPPPL